MSATPSNLYDAVFGFWRGGSTGGSLAIWVLVKDGLGHEPEKPQPGLYE